MLIGVDHGNKQIKTVHCNPFVSGLKQSVTRPFGQNVLRYQNTYYTLSTERIPYRKDKTEDDRFFILTLFALAGEIEARGAYSSEVQRIQLAVGLPPAHFGAQVERFTQYFGQRGMVEFEVQGKPYSIYIEDVACFPQAYAAAATMVRPVGIARPCRMSQVGNSESALVSIKAWSFCRWPGRLTVRVAQGSGSPLSHVTICMARFPFR